MQSNATRFGLFSKTIINRLMFSELNPEGCNGMTASPEQAGRDDADAVIGAGDDRDLGHAKRSVDRIWPNRISCCLQSLRLSVLKALTYDELSGILRNDIPRDRSVSSTSVVPIFQVPFPVPITPTPIPPSG